MADSPVRNTFRVTGAGASLINDATNAIFGVDVPVGAASGMTTVETIASLKGLTGMSNGETRYVLGYHSAGDGGADVKRYDSLSAETDNGGTVIAPNTGSGRWISVGKTHLNAAKFGCVPGISAATQTTRMQAAINAMAATGALLYFPIPSSYGRYDINDKLTVPAQFQWGILGPHWGGAHIRQTASNKGIFEFAIDNTHTWEVRGFYLDWATQASSTDTDSNAMKFTLATSSFSGFYHGKIHDIRALKGYRGIAIIQQGGNTTPLWNVDISHVTMNDFQGNCLRFNGGATGLPALRVCHSYFRSQDLTSNVEHQMHANAAGMQFDNVSFENGTRGAIDMIGGCDAVFQNLHVEHIDLNSNQHRMIYCGNSNAQFDALTLHGYAKVFNSVGINAGLSNVSVRGLRETVELQGGSFSCLAGSDASWRVIGKTNNSNALFDPGTWGSGQWGAIQADNFRDVASEQDITANAQTISLPTNKPPEPTKLITASANRTGTILGAGRYHGERIELVNRGAGSITFAADATSNVLDGTNVTIPAMRSAVFMWHQDGGGTGVGRWVMRV
jgi:hypothetical protein